MTLKTLGNALDVLSYFTTKTSEWGLRDLAREMDINHSILHRILKTYENKGFLIQNEETKKYTLALKFLEFSGVIKQKMKLSEFIQPFMVELADHVKETVFLTMKEGNDGVIVEIAEYEQQLKFNVTIGTRTPLYVGAFCSVIMAYLPEEEQLKIMNNGMKVFTEKTITKKEELLKELKKINVKGYSFTEGEYADGVIGIATPLFNMSGKVIGSLTIAGSAHRMQEENIAPILECLKMKTTMIQKYFNDFDNVYC